MKKKYWILLIAGCVLALYYPLNFASFNSLDDYDLIERILNSKLSKGTFFPRCRPYYYRPVLYSTFYIDRYLHLCDSSIMHLENIIFHLLNSLMVYYISLQLLKNVTLAGISALLFAIHPVNTEAVNWISARTDLMAGFFSFLALMLLLRYPSYSGILFSGISLLAGLLCKESAAGFFPFSLMLVFYFLRKELSYEKKLFFLFILFCVGISYLMMRYPELRPWTHHKISTMSIEKLLPEGGKKQETISVSGPLLYQVGVFFKVIGFYFKKLFVPWPLNFAIVKINGRFYLFFGMVMMLAIVYAAKKEKISGISFSWALCFMIPAVFVPLRRLAWTPLAERYIYISSFGMALFTANAVKMFGNASYKRYIHLGLAGYMLLFCLSTAYRNYIWQDNYRLYSDTVRKSPDFGPAHNELAIALLKKGRIEEAKKEFEIAASLTKGYALNPIAKVNRLLLEQENFKPDEVLKRYDRLIKEADNSVKPILLHHALRYINDLFLNNKTPESESKKFYKKEIEYFKMLSKFQEKAFCNYKIGQLYLAMGNKKEAIVYFKKACNLAGKKAFFKQAACKLAKRIKGQR